MSSSSFKVSFYLKKNQVNKNGKSIIMVRITLNGVRTQFSSKLEIEPKHWNARANKVNGRSLSITTLNSSLDDLKSTIITSYYETIKLNPNVSGEQLRNIYLGVHRSNNTLLKLFKEHNEGLVKMVGVSITKDSLNKV